MVVIKGAETNMHKRSLWKSKFTNFSITNLLNVTTLAYSIKVKITAQKVLKYWPQVYTGDLLTGSMHSLVTRQVINAGW